MHRAHPLVLAVALVVLAAAPASAATVDLGVGERDTGPVWEVRYTAAAGERNDVTVATVDDFTLRVSDAGAPIGPEAGCRSIDAGTVECSNAGESYSEMVSTSGPPADWSDAQHRPVGACAEVSNESAGRVCRLSA